MKYTELVLEERQNREQARALERRHAEVFALEREREPRARVAEEAPEITVDAEPGPGERQQLPPGQASQIREPFERGLEHGSERGELAPVLGHVAVDRGRILRVDRRDLALQRLEVRARVERAALLEHEPVVRVEPDQLDFLVQAASAHLEDTLEHLRKQEERRATVEDEAVGAQRRRASTDLGATLDNGDVEAGR